MNIPTKAKDLLDFIGDIEAPRGYGTIYGNNQRKLPKPLTSMTFNEVQKAQPSWTKRFGSSASGRYQFMYRTLKGLHREMSIKGSTKFTDVLQDDMGYHLLKRRGFQKYLDGSISRTEFGKRLAKEWASFPVLASTKGAHRQLTRGQSYYAGDKVNKSLVSPEQVERVLSKLRYETTVTKKLKKTITPKRTVTQEPWIAKLIKFIISLFKRTP